MIYVYQIIYNIYIIYLYYKKHFEAKGLTRETSRDVKTQKACKQG